MTMRSILKDNHSNLSLVIGNGVNLHNSNTETNTWKALLEGLAKKYSGDSQPIQQGVSLTEFYDILNIKYNPKERKNDIQKDFCAQISDWEPSEHHYQIVEWAKRFNVPILTTNFDNALGMSANCKLLRTTEGRKEFTDFYPWESYYANSPIESTSNSFGIWHINGVKNYHRSIRLGLTHYMGSVQRARNWIYGTRGNERFSAEKDKNWRGKNSWINIIFNNSLLFFGLGLDENEVFLRWLLIERARYFLRYPDKKKSAWYVHPENLGSGKKYFLEGVGIEAKRVDSYDDIYGRQCWI